MNTTLLNNATDTRRLSASERPALPFATPHFDTQPGENALRILVWVPGVETSGIEITTRETDLTITARKSHVVRRNWQTLHLESAQKDYQLSLRLGRNLDYSNLSVELRDGLLTIDVPTLGRQSPFLDPSRAA